MVWVVVSHSSCVLSFCAGGDSRSRKDGVSAAHRIRADRPDQFDIERNDVALASYKTASVPCSRTI